MSFKNFGMNEQPKLTPDDSGKVRLGEAADQSDATDEAVIETALNMLREHFKSDDVFIIANKPDPQDSDPDYYQTGRLYTVTPQMSLREGGLLLLAASNTFFKYVGNFDDTTVQAVVLSGIQYIQGTKKAAENYDKAGEEVAKFLQSLADKKEGDDA